MFEPYAAKAIVQHSWTATILSIWLTFRFPMNQKIKPLDTVWLVKVDGVVKAVASSAWQDAYTMLLTVGSIATAPAAVMVSFDGPDSLLETTWHKNWEPWGYIPSTDFTATYLPAGVIMLWSGSIVTIPTGWALCNGSNGTPDLRNRFIVGAGSTYNPAATGGAVQHLHSLTVEPFNMYLSSGGDIASGDGYDSQGDEMNLTGTTANTNHLPPYYALAYIMKL